MKRILGVVVSLEQLDNTHGFGELIHRAFRAVEVDALDAGRHDVSTSFAHEPGNGFSAARIVGDVLARTEILHAGMYLSADSKRGRARSSRNRAPLFRSEDA